MRRLIRVIFAGLRLVLGPWWSFSYERWLKASLYAQRAFVFAIASAATLFLTLLSAMICGILFLAHASSFRAWVAVGCVAAGSSMLCLMGTVFCALRSQAYIQDLMIGARRLAPTKDDLLRFSNAQSRLLETYLPQKSKPQKSTEAHAVSRSDRTDEDAREQTWPRDPNQPDESA